MKLQNRKKVEIPNINTLPAMIEGRAALEDLRQRLKEATSRLMNYRNRPGVPAERADSERDARVVLDGGSLTAVAVKDTRAELVRNRDALTRAVSIKESELKQIELDTIQEVCKELEPTAKVYGERVIECFEQLREALISADNFYENLSSMGFALNSRPVQWRLTSFERTLLNGGGGVPELDWFIRQRRGLWNLKQK